MNTDQTPAPATPTIDQFLGALLQPQLRPLYEMFQGMSRRIEALEQRVMKLEQRPTSGDPDQAVSDFLATDRLDSAVRGVVQRELDAGSLSDVVADVAAKSAQAYLESDSIDNAIKDKFQQMLEDGDLDRIIKDDKIEKVVQDLLENARVDIVVG